MKNKKIRIGILSDTEYTPFWAYEMIRMASELPDVEIPLLVLNSDKVSNKKSFFNKVYDRLSILFSILYLTLDQKLFKRKIDAFEAKSFKDLLPDAKRIFVSPIKTKFRDNFNKKDLNKIESFDLDIILCRGFRILTGEILNLPRFGVWSYHHGDNDENRGRPAVFYETVQRWNSIGTILQILKEELDNGIVIYKSKSGHKSKFVFKNMNSVYWKSSFFLKRCIVELQSKGWDRFINDKLKKYNSSINIYDRPLFTIPTNTQAIKLITYHYYNMIKDFLFDKIIYDQWHIAISQNSDISRLSMHRFNLIKIPKHRFWADPIIINFDSKTLIYFEDYHYKKKKGIISVIELPKNIKEIDYSSSKIALEKDYHLSYPFVFIYKNELYMVPETSSINNIDLYKCIDGYNNFKYVKTLISNVKALDSTLIYKDNLWWLFTNVVSHPAMSSYEELFLFYTDDLIKGEWIEHDLNPIVSDISSSRSAGPIFERDGKYYRPSQICSPIYGFGIAINEILVWSKSEYEEVKVEQINAEWEKSFKTIHTISQIEDIVVVDVAKRKFRFN